MKTLFEAIHEPIIIGAFVLAILIVIASYVGSHYYYGDVEVIKLDEPLALAPSQPTSQTSPELDWGKLPENDIPTELESELIPSDGISIEEFMAELSEEEKQGLAEEVADELPRESPHGLGPISCNPTRLPAPKYMGRFRRAQ